MEAGSPPIIRPRTDAERAAWVAGFIAATEMALRHGAEAARRNAKLLADLELQLAARRRDADSPGGSLRGAIDALRDVIRDQRSTWHEQGKALAAVYAALRDREEPARPRGGGASGRLALTDEQKRTIKVLARLLAAGDLVPADSAAEPLPPFVVEDWKRRGRDLLAALAAEEGPTDRMAALPVENPERGAWDNPAEGGGS